MDRQLPAPPPEAGVEEGVPGGQVRQATPGLAAARGQYYYTKVHYVYYYKKYIILYMIIHDYTNVYYIIQKYIMYNIVYHVESTVNQRLI